MTFFQIKDGNLWLYIKVKPNSKNFKIINAESELKIYINAIAQDGKANKELIERLSNIFSTPKTSIEIAKGNTISNKLVIIYNIEMTKEKLYYLLGLIDFEN
jgi:uncharacterized protein (TIGR00251 family)